MLPKGQSRFFRGMDSTNSPQSLEQSGAIGGTAAGQQQAIFGQAGAKQTLRAYHGDHAVKLKYVGRMRAHWVADELVHGIYWEGGKGCGIGCTVHSAYHNAYETELGMPEWLARLEDEIFESMSEAASYQFPLRLLSAIPVGFAEWDRLYHDFCAHILKDICGFDRTKCPDVAAAVDTIVHLHEQMTEGDDQAWMAAAESARSAAYSAADSAAWAAVRSAAMSAWPTELATMSAWAAAESAAESARSAAYSAADSAAWAAVQSAAYGRMADWLVRRFAAPSCSD